ncbi:copper chaperone PCu(A)C [Tepidimonas taiwanensis]|jgi:copper(I)-binding protein|uniref:Copper chaperone PCu(A)C n=1 Tax=Tepidimonas taiwanensis TaxID=307486 RepID=A0A554XAV0_9BURK|nr:copper chaperone PCu(A)C [Tepidimonas taiwanensis]MCX7693198.1 copper chaperone PCu(A)C [Tepidimonas taiwanensis]TSE32960.1 Copper chaperone PCu(A)C [Tepidimonas taiwanensis]UBQ04506.1 copper chaperone PCu(A)C [Tepidimonas taiwanensis]
MNHIRSIIALAALCGFAMAHAQTVKVEEPWVRGTVAQQKATGAFMRLTAPEPMRLVAAESPVAGVVEIHEMAMENQVMRMRAIPALPLAANRPVELKPGGYHVMLMDLKQPLTGGQEVPITLVFENAAGQRVTQTIAAPVKALGTAGGMSGGQGGGHQHGGHGGHKH